jgi:hypothetical protein
MNTVTENEFTFIVPHAHGFMYEKCWGVSVAQSEYQ